MGYFGQYLNPVMACLSALDYHAALGSIITSQGGNHENRYTVALAMFAGIAIGATAIQGLHAQVKPKVYSVTEIEVLDQAALATYAPLVNSTIKAAGARNFNTGGGKMTAFTGEPPKRVAHNSRER